MNRKFFLISVLIIIMIAIIGCDSINSPMKGVDDNEDLEDRENSQIIGDDRVLSIDPDPKPDEDLITIYFKHKYSDYLVPEVRLAVRGKQSWEQLIVEELLKGPNEHDRSYLMPLGVEVLDVTRKDSTVFVNLSKEFNDDINLTGIPGKEDIPEEKRAIVKAEMKQLGIYSIVNSLTELDGVTNVKFLVENRSISYSDLDEDFAKLIFSGLTGEEQSSNNALLVALSRDRSYILTPSKSVETVFEGLIGEPNWDRVYSLLSKETASKESLPTKEELEKIWPVLISSIELEEEFILDEEIKSDGRAFVTASFNINYASGRKESIDKGIITVVDEDNIWKVRLPEFISDFQ